MRKLIFNLHLYIALVAAGFVIILGITGSIMAFEPEIDHLLHWKMTFVKPAGRALSLTEIGAAVGKAYPAERIVGYSPSPSPDMSYRVILENDDVVFVNQYTGQVLGVVADGPNFLSYVHQLHLRLLIPHEGDASDVGKKIMSWAGVAMVLLVLSGLYLWWPQKRISLSKGSSGRRFWLDLHNMIGILSLLFLLALSLTGVLIGFERTTTPLLYKMTGSQPSQPPRKFPAPAPGATPISPDQAIEIARGAVPGATPFAVLIPNPQAPYLVRLRYPEDRTPGGRSRAIIDRYTGQVLFAEGSRTAPAGARIVIANRAVHTGDIFGIPSKIVMSLASLMLVVQAISGIVMWWKRLGAKRKARNLAKAAST